MIDTVRIVDTLFVQTSVLTTWPGAITFVAGAACVSLLGWAFFKHGLKNI